MPQIHPTPVEQWATEHGAPVVLALPFELLRVAAGHPMRLRTTAGDDVALRLPTVDEFLATVEDGRRWHEERGLRPPPPTTREKAAELVRPIDI